MPVLDVPPPAKPRPFRFSKSNAADLARKSHDARRRNAQARQPIPQASTPQPASNPVPPAQHCPQPPLATSVALPVTSPFQTDRLSKLRAQIVEFDEMIKSESAKPTPDTQALERLARSLTHLSAQERDLSGRPLPGSYRPEPVREEETRSLTQLSAIELSSISRLVTESAKGKAKVKVLDVSKGE